MAIDMLDLGVNVALMGVGAAAGVVRHRVRSTMPARRLWPFDQVTDLTVLLANSAATHTGEHMRPGTGIGQVRALGIIAPSLARAHRELPPDAVQLVRDGISTRMEGDLVAIGGPKTNPVTKDILARALVGVPVRQVDATISWGDTDYSGQIHDEVILQDYGLVVRCTNPYARARTAIVFSGSHTYGTIAAARWYVENERVIRKLGRHFVALVTAEVREGHVYQPELVEQRSLT